MLRMSRYLVVPSLVFAEFRVKSQTQYVYEAVDRAVSVATD